MMWSDPRAGRRAQPGMADTPWLIATGLLAAVIVLLAPTSRALLTYAVARSRSHTRTLLVGLPHPRPPSLLVLSISRT